MTFWAGQSLCTKSCEAERENIMAVLYLFEAQKGLSVDVGDGASADCP